MSNKLIVILGPTSSGKSALAVKLAKKYNGEIISADSRQVYKGLDIGSGKITKKEKMGIPHHLLGIASPKRKFSVARYQALAAKKIRGIQRRGHVPFLVGGTGFYIQSVVDNTIIPSANPNWKLRKRLEKKSPNELFLMLKKLDPSRAQRIDSKNPRRLIRAIEIVKATGKPIEALLYDSGQKLEDTTFQFLQIGIEKSKEELKGVIRKRLIKRLNEGMITEVRRLHRQGLSWKRLEELGLEYRFVSQYLQTKITYQEMLSKIQKKSEQLAKRQMTWFSRDKRIRWVKSQKEAEKLVRETF